MSNPNEKSKHTPVFITTNYLLTPSGEVLSLTGWRGTIEKPMVQDLNSHGYKRVRLTVDGTRRVYLIHKLMTIFLGPKPSPKHEICHINGIRTDNRIENLRWGTRKDNAADREKHGRTSRGLKHSIAIKKGIYNGKTK